MANVTLTTSWTQIDYWTAPYYDSITQTNYTAQLRLVARVTSQSIANNTSEVYFKWQKRLSSSASGRMVYNNNSYTYNITCNGAGGEAHSASITFVPGTVSSSTWTDVGGTNYWGNVTHSADGSLTVSATATGTRFSGVAFETAETLTFPTIPRASKPTFDKTSVTLDGSDSIVISTNRASSSFTHTLKITVGDNTATFTDVGASMTFAPTPSIWMPYMSSYEMTATVACTTYSGSTQIGSQQTATFKMQVDTSVYKPTIGTITKSDTNTTTSALETSGTFIKGYSNLSMTVTFGINDTGYDSALASAKITCGSVSQSYPLSGTSGSASFTANAITDSTVIIEVTDNRGYKVTQNVALTMVDYSPVTISSVKGERVNQSGTPSETGEYIKYTVECNVFRGTFGQVSNELKLYTYSKLTSASDYGSAVLEQTVTPTGSNANDSYTFTGITVGTYSASSQYDIRFRVEDKLSYKISAPIRINEGVPVYAWGEDHFDVYGTFHIHDRDDITKYISLNGLNPSTEAVTFSGAQGGTVNWNVFAYGSLRICTAKWSDASNRSCSTAWGGMYTCTRFDTPDYPVNFSAIHYENMQMVQADANANYSALVIPQLGSTLNLTSYGEVFLARGSTSTIGHPIYVQIVVGTV